MEPNKNLGSQFEPNKPSVRLRVANEEDIPFIFSSWLKSYKNSLFACRLPNTIYYTEHHKLIERILKVSDVIVACNNDDPSQVYGWACASKVDGIFCLHYLYVKHSFRNLGIGSILFNSYEHDSSTAGLYTQHTRPMETFAPKHNLIYHPYILINPDYLKEPKHE